MLVFEYFYKKMSLLSPLMDKTSKVFRSYSVLQCFQVNSSSVTSNSYLYVYIARFIGSWAQVCTSKMGGFTLYND